MAGGIVALTISSFAIEWAVNPLLLQLFPAALPNSGALAESGWVRALTMAYSLVCVAFGGYVCARLAPRLPMKHAVAMGIVQAGMTVMAMLSFPEIASIGQWIATALLAFPAAVTGGRFYLHRTQAAGE